MKVIFSKEIISNKTYLILLLAYLVTQFIWPVSEIIFLISTIVAIIWISKYHNKNKNFNPAWYSIFLCFIANLFLTLIYIPTLILNPEINWSLKDGRNESDPMILLAFFPTLNFIVFAFIIIIASLIIKFLSMNSESA
ncbi:hypothetical protein [Flavobacterium caeni]|uniref:Uncharacterized protein n=1 Tax=Flavobacterium caeni TaxID=490189 RepID=A0A1G5KFC0_9FLAO|nr:hypothetical protein [Flavobacterium caeni]SCY98788.1 hypothetical protein SAMN02927903_03254 [Flavobacterium caeni]